VLSKSVDTEVAHAAYVLWTQRFASEILYDTGRRATYAGLEYAQLLHHDTLVTMVGCSDFVRGNYITATKPLARTYILE
jgi:hypothetical protein